MPEWKENKYKNNIVSYRVFTLKNKPPEATKEVKAITPIPEQVTPTVPTPDAPESTQVKQTNPIISNNMKTELRKRVETFCIRTGILAVVAVATYLQNIENIQAISWNKLLTLTIAAVSANVIAEFTKYLNNKAEERAELAKLG